jgi:hypothetical protein
LVVLLLNVLLLERSSMFCVLVCEVVSHGPGDVVVVD